MSTRCEVICCPHKTEKGFVFWFCKDHWPLVPAKLKKTIRKSERAKRHALSQKLWVRAQRHVIHVVAGIEP